MIMRPRVIRLLLALLLFAAPARADSDDVAKARSLYAKGMAHFQLDEYETAIQLWQQAFRLEPAPALLYNIAQAYRLSSERALVFYKKYLNLNPRAANRAEIDHQIAALTRYVNEQQVPPPAPLVERSPPAPAQVAPPPAVTLDKKVALTLVVPPPPAMPVARRSDKPAFKKGWFWATLGISAAVVAMGVGLGVGLGTQSSSDPSPTFGIARGN
jgi:tetratricopeptide (TPR) repeat protein